MDDWHFWIDRGGTFTDVIGLDGARRLHALKLLSQRPDQYEDAAIEGIRRILDNSSAEAGVASVRMGTTVATNALLERNGEPTADGPSPRCSADRPRPLGPHPGERARKSELSQSWQEGRRCRPD